jgi:hypothetical protein
MLEWAKQIFSNWGLARDAMADPVETSGEVTKTIVERLNPALQRIVVLALIIIAMLLGADMGIDYQKSQTAPLAAPLTETIPVNP